MLGEGDFFGEMSLMTGEPRRATVVAKSDAECYVIDRALFQQILRNNATLADEIGKLLSEREMKNKIEREGLSAEAARKSTDHQALLASNQELLRTAHERDDSRMVKDPICGKDVDTLRARAVGIFGGVTYYFCSAECKAKYVDPRKSDGGAGAARDAASGDASPSREPIATSKRRRSQYAHSRVRRVTGEVGTPVVQIDLSPNKKPASPPKRATSPSDEPLEPARSGRGWAWIAIVMLILAGGVIFFTLKHR